MKAWTRRDLTIVEVSVADSIVIACDSCGAIGLKPGDVYKLPPRCAAKFTARVALTEVLCSGAVPVTITNGVAGEMKPTGEETILGIKDEIENAGLSGVILTGSTEENFTTDMTALAVTVIGTVTEERLKFGRAVKGDRFILFGKPAVGMDVDLDSRGFYAQISRLLPIPEVKEIVPVGSKGVLYEAETLAAINGMTFKPFDTDIDYTGSAGPATCLLILCAKSAVDGILDFYAPAAVIGETR